METDQATMYIILVSIYVLDQKEVFAPKMFDVVELRGRLKSCLDISTERLLTLQVRTYFYTTKEMQNNVLNNNSKQKLKEQNNGHKLKKNYKMLLSNK